MRGMTHFDELDGEFTTEGNPWSRVFLYGRSCWIAKSVGKILGYKGNGSNLVCGIRKEMGNEFEEGQDFEVLKGSRLRYFKKLVYASGLPPISNKAVNLMVLYEPGLRLALMKTRKRLGAPVRCHVKMDEL